MNIKTMLSFALMPWILAGIFYWNSPIKDTLSWIGVLFLVMSPLLIIATYCIAFVQGRTIAILETAQNTLNFVHTHKHHASTVIGLGTKVKNILTRK